MSTAFSLSPKASNGSATAKVLGYPLRDFNPACGSDRDFIGPLSLHWEGGEHVRVFDSEIHGYHGELNASAKLHGSGEPHPFLCERCGHDCFRVIFQFDYWDACDDLLDDDPTVPVQDYFCNLLCIGSCETCGKRNRILDMDL